MLRHGIVLLVFAGTLGSCSKKSPSQGASQFDMRWAELAKAGAKVSYIADDRGEGLMANVRRASQDKDDLPAVVPSDPPKPSAPVLPAEPSGEQVQRIIRGNLMAVRGCYMSMARTGQVRSGKAIVSFSIGADGKTTGLRVDAPSFVDTSLPSCVAAQVSHWQFPKSQKGGGPLSYPFVFVGS